MEEHNSSNNHSTLELTVVLVVPFDYGQVRRTIQHLREQTIRDRIEVVVVALVPEAFQVDETASEDLGQLAVVEAPGITQRGPAAALGVERASAPLVAFVEEHSFPEPGWAEAFVDSHRHSWTGVGPVMINDNPRTLAGRASFVLAYGGANEHVGAGRAKHLPWQNSSYKRSSLLHYGKELGDLLDWEMRLQEDLQDRGHSLYLNPAAKTRHLNTSRLTSFLAFNFHHGRLFGTHRWQKHKWSLARRLIYVAGAPLFPLVRLRQLVPYMRGMGPRYHPLRLTPILVLGLASNAAGEALSYALGPGDAIKRLQAYELNRRRFMSRSDRAQISTASNSAEPTPGAE